LNNDELLLEEIRNWADKEKTHNPTFSFVVGRKAFTVDEIVEHIEKDTPEGRELKKMIFSTATSLFFNYKPR